MRAKIDSNVKASDTKNEELTQLKAKMEQDGLEREFFESQVFLIFLKLKNHFQAKTLQESIQIKGQKLIECQTKIEQLESHLEELEDVLGKVKVESAEKLKLLGEDKLKIGNDFLGYFWRFLKLKKKKNFFQDCITSFALNLMEQTNEDSQNATSISYPPR